MLHGQTMVLVVDDEAEQLETLSRGLLMLGLGCILARDVAQALAALEGPLGGAVDLLLTDLTQPNSAGAQVLARARATRPDLPALVLTGLMLSAEVVALRAGGVPILRKPFTHEQLGSAIAGVLAPGS